AAILFRIPEACANAPAPHTINRRRAEPRAMTPMAAKASGITIRTRTCGLTNHAAIIDVHPQLTMLWNAQPHRVFKQINHRKEDERHESKPRVCIVEAAVLEALYLGRF